MIRSLNGKSPVIHPTAFVSEFAYIVGDVEIGEGSSVWPGVVIRGDSGKIKIGKFTCIQDNSVVHCDSDAEIGDYVAMGHRVLCHAIKVGNRVLLGSGSTVNDKVVIGDDAIVASGAVVLDGMQIEPKVVVAGVPGRVRGPAEERHAELIRYINQDYIRKSRLHKAEGNLESKQGQ